MVLIFRYQGPKGAPGMPEVSIYIYSSRILHKKLGEIDVRQEARTRQLSSTMLIFLRLGPTGALIGAGLGDCTALITDGRFSGASHGFIIGA